MKLSTSKKNTVKTVKTVVYPFYSIDTGSTNWPFLHLFFPLGWCCFSCARRPWIARVPRGPWCVCGAHWATLQWTAKPRSFWRCDGGTTEMCKSKAQVPVDRLLIPSHLGIPCMFQCKCGPENSTNWVAHTKILWHSPCQPIQVWPSSFHRWEDRSWARGRVPEARNALVDGPLSDSLKQKPPHPQSVGLMISHPHKHKWANKCWLYTKIIYKQKV